MRVNVSSFEEGCDPYNSATTYRPFVMERLGEEYHREMRAARARFGDEYACQDPRTFELREQVARDFPYENFPEGVNIRITSIFD